MVLPQKRERVPARIDRETSDLVAVVERVATRGYGNTGARVPTQILKA
jgi:hypothetical protein